jgi:hypothetical protein
MEREKITAEKKKFGIKRLNPDPQPWFFADSLVEVAEEDWCTRLSAALTAQLSSFYEPESLEKAFALRALGHVTRLLTSDQLILDNLSALYLAVTHNAMESACAKAFGNLKKFLLQNLV